MGYSVHLEGRWTDNTKVEVTGTMKNNSIGEGMCTWAFHKHGVWTDYRGAYLKPGESITVGSAGVDSSTIRYVCFEGADPVNEHGNSCTAGLRFNGMTDAGTDR